MTNEESDEVQRIGDYIVLSKDGHVLYIEIKHFLEKYDEIMANKDTGIFTPIKCMTIKLDLD